MSNLQLEQSLTQTHPVQEEAKETTSQSGWIILGESWQKFSDVSVALDG
jgi:hypothetical protein